LLISVCCAEFEKAAAMDVNGLNFWMLAEQGDWLPPAGSSDLSYCVQNSRLQLRGARTGPPLTEIFSIASALVEVPPMARDSFGNYARWDAGSGHVVAGGSAPGEVPIFAPPPLQPVTDLALGYDGILYVAVAGSLIFIDRRNRWPNFTLTDSNFNFWRLLPLPAGGILALDRANARLGVVTGQPPQDLPLAQPDPKLLRSCRQNPDPPRILAQVALPASEAWIALSATSNPGQFALLSWSTADAANQSAWLRLIGLDTSNFQVLSISNQAQIQAAPGLAASIRLQGIVFPYALACLDNTRFATLVSNSNEALIFDLSGFDPATPPATVPPAGDSYILAAANLGPFVHGFDQPPYYANGTGMLPLLPLSLNAFFPSGTAVNQSTIDSGTAQSTWHRLFLEAIVPPRTGVIVWLAASDDPANLSGTSVQWFPHVVGAVDMSTLPQETPRAVWLSTPTEIAFAAPLLAETPVRDVQGLFMALVQRANTAVRSLRGRYLAVKLELSGDRRSTPQIAALRIYASRFSYVDNYLPELYREDTFGDDADLPGPCTRPDFFERFVDIFEGQLTRIEDRVANAYLVTRPESTPDPSLDWLGGWIGITPGNYPPGRRRARIAATPRLYEERGTTQGVIDALDIATGGLCTRGAVIVIEDFRLRHTFATILGADLSISDDPLLPGYSASSNSFVGDTLFLGDPYNAEFLALFADDIRTASEQAQVDTFFDQLAHRLTVFVHDQVETVDLGLISSIVEEEKPAHVSLNILRATQGFMIGLASLVGVNTYLGPSQPPGVATVDGSQIGRYDLITHLPSLDPRIESDPDYAGNLNPVARLAGPSALMENAATITLDATASTASPGSNLVAYTWTLQPPGP
jgi:phage tail-like protein